MTPRVPAHLGCSFGKICLFLIVSMYWIVNGIV